jgi:hypothetical protein
MWGVQFMNLRTTLMQKLLNLIYLLVYFCLTCFGLPFSPSSEAGLQLREWFKPPGYGVRARALTPYPGAKRKPQTCKAEVN